jgi:hypothetical protein
MTPSTIYRTNSGLIISRLFFITALLLSPLSVGAATHEVTVDNEQNRTTSMNGRINVVEATVSTDVSVGSIASLGGSHQAGEDFIVKATLNNTGVADSGMFNVRFYASTDNAITSGDTLLGTGVVSDISAGASKNIEESVDLPADLASGDYYIGAIIDLDDNNLDNNINADGKPVFVFTVFTMNAGLNDAWFNPATDGQGFFITVFPDLDFVTLAWFTYDTVLPAIDATANLGDPGHRWFTAGGVIDAGKSVMDIEFTSGGVFDTPSEVLRTDPVGSDGTLTLNFDNCSFGTIEYDITSINARGMVPIRRVANDNEALCIALLEEAQPDL